VKDEREGLDSEVAERGLLKMLLMLLPLLPSLPPATVLLPSALRSANCVMLPLLLLCLPIICSNVKFARDIISLLMPITICALITSSALTSKQGKELAAID
jgi:hypothetical protein